MIKKYAIIENGIVASVIVWDTENGNVQDMTPLEVVETTDAVIGDLYVDGQFVKPEPTTPVEENI
jgi:hypothetical protein